MDLRYFPDLMQDNKGIGSFLFCSCKDGTCLLLFNQKYTQIIAHVKYLLEKKMCQTFVPVLL